MKNNNLKYKIKIRKGDLVKIIAGKDKGKTGKVEKIFPKKNKILVARINVFKRHLKPQGQNKPGGIVDISKPFPVSKAMFICPKCGQPTRIGFLIDKSGKKSRICKKCSQVIDK